MSYTDTDIARIESIAREQRTTVLQDLNGKPSPINPDSTVSHPSVILPHQNLDEVQLYSAFFFKSNTNDNGVQTFRVYLYDPHDGGEPSYTLADDLTIRGTLKKGKIYVIQRATEDQFQVLEFHDPYTYAFEDNFDVYDARVENRKETLQSPVLETTTIKATNIEYNGKENDIITERNINERVMEILEDFFADRFIVDSRSPEQYEADTGETLDDNVFYYQVTSQND